MLWLLGRLPQRPYLNHHLGDTGSVAREREKILVGNASDLSMSMNSVTGPLTAAKGVIVCSRADSRPSVRLMARLYHRSKGTVLETPVNGLV